MVDDGSNDSDPGGAPRGSESKLAMREVSPTPTPPPSVQFGVPGPMHPVTPQQQVGLAVQFGQQSAEALALQKLTPEGVSDAIKRAHELEGRRIDVQERQLTRDSDQEERQRERDHELRVSREDRRWKLGWVLLAAVALLIGGVFHANGAEAAIKVAKDLGGYVLVFVGGAGAEKLRREWGKRKG